MKANPVSRHCGGGGAGLSVAKLAGDVFFRACQEWLSEEMWSTLMPPQTGKPVRCFTLRPGEPVHLKHRSARPATAVIIHFNCVNTALSGYNWFL